MAITIGSAATSRASSSSITTYTRIWRNGPCSGNGTIGKIEIYTGSSAVTGLKIGTFYGSSTTYTNRDYESLGSVDANTKKTFTGLSIDAQTNDVLGIIATAGSILYNTAGSVTPGLAFKSGDQFGTGEQSSYTTDGNVYACSLYGESSVVDVQATANDSSTVTENASVKFGQLYASSFDAIATSEQVSLKRRIIEVADSASITESSNISFVDHELSGFQQSDWSTDGQTLFVGKDAKIYKSTDYGETFTLWHTFTPTYNPSSGGTIPPGKIFALTIPDRVGEETADVLLCSLSLSGTLYRCADLTAETPTFTEVLNRTEEYTAFNAICEDDDGNLYAGLYAAANGADVYKSTDRGVNWVKIKAFDSKHIHDIRFNRYNGWLYVLVGEAWPFGADSYKTFRSKDSGSTWQLVWDGSGSMINPAHITFYGDDVFIGDETFIAALRIFKFTDDGVSEPFSPETVYTRDGVDKITYGGAGCFNGVIIFTTMAHDDTEETVLSAIHSYNRGASWVEENETVQGTEGYSCTGAQTSHPERHNRTFYALSAHTGFYEDYIDRYVPVDDGLGITDAASASILSSPLSVSASDAIDITDEPTQNVGQQYITASESIEVTENNTQYLGQQHIRAAESLAVSESNNQYLGQQFITASDAIEVTESNVLSLGQYFISAYDEVNVTEDVTVSLFDTQLFITADDSIEVTEEATQNVGQQFISTGDDIVVTEDSPVNLVTITGVAVNAYEDVGIVEAAEQYFKQKYATSNDSVVISEEAVLYLKQLRLMVSDNISVLEGCTLTTTQKMAHYDGVYIMTELGDGIVYLKYLGTS